SADPKERKKERKEKGAWGSPWAATTTAADVRPAEVARPVRRKGPEVAANRRANLRASRRARRAPAAPAPTLTAFLCHPPCPGGGTHTGLGYRTSPLPFLSHFLARGLVSSAFVCIFVFCFVNSRYSPATPEPVRLGCDFINVRPRSLGYQTNSSSFSDERCLVRAFQVPLKHVKWKRSIIIDSMKMRDAKGARD
ncbi:hypothetical protein ALC57_02051, partial [Trachymyrmex cornetzi]